MLSTPTIAEISNWTIINGNSPYFSTCGTYNLFGGYNIFNDLTILQRNFTNLPSHYKFEMDIIFFTIDSFSGKTLNIYFDNVLVATYTFQLISTPPAGFIYIYLNSKSYIFGQLVPGYFSFTGANKYGYAWISASNLCGGTSSEYNYIIKIVSEHNISSLSMSFNITGNAGVGYWGMKSFSYLLWSQAFHSTCTSDCLICNQGSCAYCNGLSNQEDACISTCSSNYATDTSNTLKCYSCYNGCNTCTNDSPGNCLTCQSNYWLMDSSCVPSCPANGYYSLAVNNTCISCHSSCLSCSGSSNSQCITCPNGSLFLNGSCLSNCPINYYNQLNICLICDVTCNTCNGPSQNNCLTCLSGYFCNGYCVSQCFSGQYLNVSNNSCENCDLSCGTCSGPLNNECVSCVSPFYLSLNSCVIICPSNQIANILTLSCDLANNTSMQNNVSLSNNTYTQNNTSISNITSISNNTSTSNNTLTSNTSISNNTNLSFNSNNSFISNVSSGIIYNKMYVKLIELNNPFAFQLNFISENNSQLFYQYITKSLLIQISNFRQNLFNYSIIQNSSSTNFTLNFSFLDQILPQTSYLIININSSIDSSIQIMNNTLNALLNFYNPCAIKDSSDYYIENGECIKKLTFDYDWIYTNQCQVISILFKTLDTQNTLHRRLLTKNSNNYSSLNPIIAEGIREGIFYAEVEYVSLNKYLQYQFQINNDSVDLIVNFSDYIYGGVNLILKLNNSRFLQVNNSEKINILKKQLTLSIMDYSVQSDKTRETLMEQTSQISFIGETAVMVLLYLSYVFNPKSSFTIRGLLITTLFQILKYVKINYPQNARIIFTSKNSAGFFFSGQIIPIQNIDELLYGFPQIYIYYNTSILLINNILDEYIFVFIIFSGCLILILINSLKCKEFIKKFISFLYSVFVWNFLIMISFSKYVNTTFFVVLSIRYSYGFDVLNSVISFLAMIAIIYNPIHILKVIAIVNRISLKINNPPSPFKKIIKSNKVRDGTKGTDILKKSKFFIKEQPIELKILEIDNNNIDNNYPNNTSISPTKILHDYRRKTKKIVPWNNFIEYETPKLKPSINLHISVDLQEKTADDIYLSNPSSTKCLKIVKNLELELENNTNILTDNTTIESPKKNSNLRLMSPPSFDDKKDINKLNNKDIIYEKLIRFIKGPIILIDMLLYKIKDEYNYSKKYMILQKDFRESLGLHKYYFAFDLIRYLIIPSIVVILYGYALLQMTIICLTNLLFFTFLIFDTPFRRKSTSFYSYFNEICINVSYISAFCLSLLDINENFNINLRINFGWAIVFSYISLLCSLLINALIRIIKGIFKFLRKIIKKF